MTQPTKVNSFSPFGMESVTKFAHLLFGIKLKYIKFYILANQSNSQFSSKYEADQVNYFQQSLLDPS